MPDSNRKHSWAVVLAGGDGTRLKELTQLVAGDSRPKQFCSFFGGKSLLEHTRERIAPLFCNEQTLFVLTRAHEEYYSEELSEVRSSLRLVQPANRGTGVAMALCLQSVLRQDEDAVVAFFPSDHYHSDCSAFRAIVDLGLRTAEEYPNCILMLGAEARYPEVEYGWIQPGRILADTPVNPLRRVTRFWEKPPLRRATLLQRRGCLWNTFITMGLASAYLELLDASVPQLLLSLSGHLNDQLDPVYERIVPVDFSRDVSARMPQRLLVLSDAASGWTDLGSPRRIIDVLTHNDIRPPWLHPGLELSSESRRYAT